MAGHHRETLQYRWFRPSDYRFPRGTKPKEKATVQKETSQINPNRKPDLREGLLYKTYYHLPKGMSKLAWIVNILLAFVALRFFVTTDFRHLGILDIVLLIVIVVWGIAGITYVISYFRDR
ncbi:hypothetical protein GS458_2700 [Geobacillus stearothermophilus]|nr:hypothetical protein GS458_2700 [Geobacillus stearothermophilus]